MQLAEMGQVTGSDDRWAPFRELRDSIMLLALTASSLGAYIGLGVVVVRLIAR